METNRGPKKLRIWQPDQGEWRLTKLGTRYYRTKPSEYIISIPVRYDILRDRDDSEVFYKGYMPVSQLSAKLRDRIAELSAQGSEDDLLERIRRGVLSEVIR